MAHTIKLGLLGINLGRSRAKNPHELAGELHGLNVIHQPMELVGLPAPVSVDSAFVNGNLEYIVIEAV